MSLVFQPSGFRLLFKYTCVHSCTTANLGKGGKTPKFISSKRCKAALMPGWEAGPPQQGGKRTVTCQNICSPALVRCVNSAGCFCGSLWPQAPEGDERVGSGLALRWAHHGLAAAAVFPLPALLGYRHASLMFPLLTPAFVPAVPLGLLTKSSCSRLSLNLFLLLGRVRSPCLVAWQEAGQLSAAMAGAAQQRCSTSPAAVEAGREPFSVLSVKPMATLVSHPVLCLLPDVH